MAYRYVRCGRYLLSESPSPIYNQCQGTFQYWKREELHFQREQECNYCYLITIVIFTSSFITCFLNSSLHVMFKLVLLFTPWRSCQEGKGGFYIATGIVQRHDVSILYPVIVTSSHNIIMKDTPWSV